MKRLLSYWLLLLMLLPAVNLRAQKLIRNTKITGMCFAGNKVKRIYIAPPEEYYRKAGSKGISNITVYYSGFPAYAVPPVEFAVSVLETMLPAGSNITILATWANITTSGVLANSSVTGYAGGWVIDALEPFAYYPVALAEKILGEPLNTELYPDIELSINSSINWYFATDGSTPTTQYDLVTIVLHELIHGLGFFDSMNVGTSTGFYGGNSIPVIYDTFIENDLGRRLTDTLIFNNPSVELKNELTSNKLYFDGPLLDKYSNGGKARLYAPVTYTAGSSISHLDEDTYPVENGLLTPFIDKGEAIHNPGKFTMSMLGDLGWINTRIVHDPPQDTEENLSQIDITATIISDTTYNHNNIGLVWSFDQFTTSDTTYLISPQSNNTYTATLTVPGYDSELQYYLFAEDVFHRIYRLPSFIDLYRFSVRIGTDTVKPLLTHKPADYYLESVDTFRFEAMAVDNIGIDTLVLEYKINEGPSAYLGMKPDGELTYSNSLNASTLTFAGGDSLRYRITAYDKAAVPNSRTLPASGYFAVIIEDIGPVLESYTTNFTDAGSEFFNIGFDVSKPSGFSEYGLHSKHPYESPETDGDSIVYVAMLRNPVIFDAIGMVIKYKDLALVEPGEVGSVFRTVDFYDYVVLEGSVDFGRTWFSLADGYDSRYTKSWETLYNSAISGQNSASTGNESLLMEHTLFPVPNARISAGDSLMVRFRLFSDPYAYGWGWVIEDFHIGPLINSIEDPVADPVIIYPNPGRGLITLRGDFTGKNSLIRYSIYNTAGKCVLTGYTGNETEISLDISSQPSGIYFINLEISGGSRTLKYSLIR